MEIKCKEQTQAHMMKRHDLMQDRTGRGQFYCSGQCVHYLSYQFYTLSNSYFCMLHGDITFSHLCCKKAINLDKLSFLSIN